MTDQPHIDDDILQALFMRKTGLMFKNNIECTRCMLEYADTLLENIFYETLKPFSAPERLKITKKIQAAMDPAFLQTFLGENRIDLKRIFLEQSDQLLNRCISLDVAHHG
jgi:hypothetical protein